MARHLEFKKVQYADIQDYLDDVAHAYSEETGLGVPRDPNHAGFLRLEEANSLLCVAGYDEGILSGVAVFSIGNDLLDKSVVCGLGILLYTSPTRRHTGMGSGLLTMAERLLVDAGCDKIFIGFMEYNRIDKLLTGRGYRPYEQWYCKEVN